MLAPLELAKKVRYLYNMLQPYRPRLEAFDRTNAERTQREKLLGEARLGLERAERDEANARQCSDEALQTLVAARKALEDASPRLKEARRLDTMLETSQKDCQSADVEAEQRRAEVTIATAEVARLQKASLTLESEAADLHHWHNTHLDETLLAEQWSTWKPLLQTCVEVQGALATLNVRAQQHDTRLKTASQALAAAQASEAIAQQKADGDQADVARLEAWVDEINADSLTADRNTVHSKVLRLNRLKAVAANAVRVQGDAVRCREKAETARTEALAAGIAADLAVVEVARLEIQREEATQTLRRIEASVGLADKRHLLQTNEPCPLCGALEHPWAEQGGVTASILQEQEGRVKALEKELQALRRQVAEQETLKKTRLRTSDEEGANASRLEAELAICFTEWQNECVPTDLAEFGTDPAAPALMSGLEAHLLTSQRQEASLNERFQDLETRRREATLARNIRDESSVILRKAQVTTREAQATFNTASTAHQLVLGEISTQQERGADAHSQLQPLLACKPLLRQPLQEQPERLLLELEKTVQAWNLNRERTAQVQTELREISIHLDNAHELQSQATRNHSTCIERLTGLRGAHNDLLAQRSQVLEGRNADTVEEVLRQGLTDAQEENATAENARNAASVLTAEARTRLRSAESALESSELSQDQDTRALESVLLELAIDASTLRLRLSHDLEWRQTRRSELDLLGRNLATAQQVHQSRADELSAHQITPPPLDAKEAEQMLVDTRERRAKAEQRKGALRLQCSQDDANQQKAQSLDRRILAQETESVLWQRIDEVIGSKDGKKFRQFAQRMTLDLLLGYTNRHLSELAPRYRLQRVPDVDMELQIIDQDMGNEIRSVNTLSGGETFLVSLGLALGLASLASGSTRIESLFIDEGFGSLDPETLDQAISVLDGLQATGRKVGVISHVPGLAERLGVQVRVRPRGAARSLVDVVAR